jgi:hypothetical protein
MEPMLKGLGFVLREVRLVMMEGAVEVRGCSLVGGGWWVFGVVWWVLWGFGVGMRWVVQTQVT